MNVFHLCHFFIYPHASKINSDWVLSSTKWLEAWSDFVFSPYIQHFLWGFYFEELLKALVIFVKRFAFESIRRLLDNLSWNNYFLGSGWDKRGDKRLFISYYQYLRRVVARNMPQPLEHVLQKVAHYKQSLLHNSSSFYSHLPCTLSVSTCNIYLHFRL